MWKYLRLGSAIVPLLLPAQRWINRQAENKKNESINTRYARTKKLVCRAFKHFKIDLYIDGMENIPLDTNVLFVPNHQSLLDAVILIYLLDRPMTFVAKAESLKMPYIGHIIKGIDGIFLERDNLRQEIRALGRVSDSLENNKELSWTIFPEGTRSKSTDFSLGEFKAGALKPAYNASVPIVPICIHGTRPVLDQSRHEKRYPVQVSFLSPIRPEEFEKNTTVEQIQIVQKKIAERLQTSIKKYNEVFNAMQIYNRKVHKIVKL